MLQSRLKLAYYIYVIILQKNNKRQTRYIKVYLTLLLKTTLITDRFSFN